MKEKKKSVFDKILMECYAIIVIFCLVLFFMFLLSINDDVIVNKYLFCENNMNQTNNIHKHFLFNDYGNITYSHHNIEKGYIQCCIEKSVNYILVSECEVFQYEME